MSESASKTGLYGRNITTEMRQTLSWRAIYLLDLFEGLWRKKNRVYLSNSRIAKEFDCSVRTVQRAIKELVEEGYISIARGAGSNRMILPGGVAIFDEDPISDHDKSVTVGRQECHGSMTTVSRNHDTGVTQKTLEEKPLKETPEGEGEPTQPESRFEYWLGEAEGDLEPVTPEIEKDPRYSQLQRRPLKKYPFMWMSTSELATVYECLERSALPENSWYLAFTLVSSVCKTQLTKEHRPPLSVNAEGYFLEFGISKALVTYRNNTTAEAAANRSKGR